VIESLEQITYETLQRLHADFTAAI
jgi:hypothetical protein